LNCERNFITSAQQQSIPAIRITAELPMNCPITLEKKKVIGFIAISDLNKPAMLVFTNELRCLHGNRLIVIMSAMAATEIFKLHWKTKSTR